ncbi:MAG: hypothetical protein CMP56_00045 [Flavobacteriales bacterium]|nr:hypothetical protein [Flavobacteriales bacterium]
MKFLFPCLFMLLYFSSCQKEDNPCSLDLCEMFCENGFLLDQNGCEICDCIIYGCMDSSAGNYNPLANIEDDSCLYP